MTREKPWGRTEDYEVTLQSAAFLGAGGRLGLTQSDGPKGGGSCLGKAEAVAAASLQVPTQVSSSKYFLAVASVPDTVP